MGVELVKVACPLCGQNNTKYERTIRSFVKYENRIRDFVIEKCKECGFVFNNPQYGSDELARLYGSRDSNAMIALYSKIASPSVIDYYHSRIDIIEKILPGKGRLLDLGCAAGYFFEQAAQRGWDAHGTDVGEWVKKAADIRGLKNLHIGFLKELNFPDHYFDVVYASGVLEHLQRLGEELTEVRRILRPGGVLHINVPNYQTLPIFFNKDDFMLNMPPQHINYFTPGTLSMLLKSMNFQIETISTGQGLKWENLLGKSIKSDIVDAYGLGDKKSEKEINRKDTKTMKSRLKQILVSFVIQPIFYERLKVGITLFAIARRL